MTSAVCNVLLSSTAIITAGPPPYSIIKWHNARRNAKSSQSVIMKNVMQEMTIETQNVLSFLQSRRVNERPGRMTAEIQVWYGIVGFNVPLDTV